MSAEDSYGSRSDEPAGPLPPRTPPQSPPPGDEVPGDEVPRDALRSAPQHGRQALGVAVPAGAAAVPAGGDEVRVRRRRRGVPQGARTHWVVHRVALWSVFKLAFFVFLVLYLVVLGASALLWWLASRAGVTHHIETFLRDVGFDNFRFQGRQLFQGVALGGAVLFGACVVFTTLAAAVVNLLSELTGGVRLVITEELPGERRTRRRPRRR